MRLSQFFAGKYTEIVIAVTFFLLFDLGVLVLNFYVSYEISSDAIAINLAGRQRMLSQKMVKELQALQHANSSTQSARKELRSLTQTVTLFHTTLKGFTNGGPAQGTDGTSVVLKPVNSVRGLAALDQANPIWGDYYKLLLPVLDGRPSPAESAAALNYARANNLVLLKLMNDLTTHLQDVASAKAERLRTIQSTGITLALINFIFILFHFLRKLRHGDRLVEQARAETKEILDTVSDGLFLLNRDFTMGEQHSRSLEAIFRTRFEPKEDFFDLLSRYVPESTLHTTREYLELLFTDRVKERLVADLNPLEKVTAYFESSSGKHETRYFSFAFNRVMVGGQFSHLLVTVTDITAKVQLERELELANRDTQKEMELLLNLLHVDPGELVIFLDHSESILLQINDILKADKPNPLHFKSYIEKIFPLMHRLKGDAAMLGLETFETLAHDFETALANLRGGVKLTANDFLPLAIRLNDFFSRITLVRGLLEKVDALGRARSELSSQLPVSERDRPNERLGQELQRLATRIASNEGKKVALSLELEPFDHFSSEHQTLIKEAVTQLLRNAIIHGIEQSDARRALQKREEGQIEVRLTQESASHFALSFRDDGRGLSFEKIRARLIELGRYSSEQLDELSRRQVLMKIFEPGFSTVNTPHRDAGHGVGMNVILNSAKQLGAHASISTQENRFLEIRLDFQADTLKQAATVAPSSTPPSTEPVESHARQTAPTQEVA